MAVQELPQIGQDPERGPEPEGYRDLAPFSVDLPDNRLTIYPGGADRLAALLGLIASAQESLRLFYYLFLPDNSGRQVRDALVEAVGRGVDVELIVDSFGSDREVEFFRPIVDAGGRFDVFMARFGTRYLIRNHQKMAIADGKAAMIGGFNVSDQYFAAPVDGGWHDLGVLVEGEAVGQLADWYEKLSGWARNHSENFRAIRFLVRNWDPGRRKVELVLGGPTRVPSSWAMRVKSDIAGARRLDMVMAYFSPPRSYRRLIAKVAGRGRARLVMAGKSDNTTTIAAARALYSGFLRNGVEIQEFQVTKMHTKLVVVDDVTYLGSANFDMRSLRLNLELMLRVEDAALAARMREFIDGLVPHACAVTPEDHRRHATLWNRIRWWCGWALVSVVDYTVTRGLNLRG